MGTRSLTFIHDQNDDPIVCIYQQYGGYFEETGEEILNFLRGSQVVNGISFGSGGTIFNGAGDLAARLITKFKEGDPNSAGNVYIVPATLVDDAMGAEYTYHIRCQVGAEPWITAKAVYQDYTTQGYASEIVWPDTDEDGNYIDVPDDGPMSNVQRAALFASFSEAFEGDTSEETRHAFTRAVLGPQAPKSWSREGGITAEQASRMLDTLKFLNS